MAAVSSSQRYIRVLCEGCSKAPSSDCLLCQGRRFYFWDPQTSFCYSEDGTQILALNEDGCLVPVVRSDGHPKVPTDTMLTFIELWVSETPVRKWKMLLDENGWQTCIWFNRYKRSCFQTSDASFDTCVERTYNEIISFLKAKSASD